MPLLGVILAITLSLKDYPLSVEPESEFPVSATLECARCSDSYLRAVFFPSGTNYFGFTQNNSGSWISTTSDKTQYFLVTADQVQSGTWSGQLHVRPDIASSDYTGPGSYNFKLIRYTASGSKSAETDPVTIQIIGPSLAPTSRPVSPTSPPVPPTRVPPSVTPIPQPSHSVSATPEVLEAAVQPEVTLSLTADPQASPPPKPWFAWIFIGVGIIGLSLAGFCLFLPG
jgi:hypothetical protein